MTNRKPIPALISLLDEPDEGTFGLIREEICALGLEAIPWLKNALENAFDHTVQLRIEEIIRKIQIDQLRFDFANWVTLGSSDLLKGYILVSRTQYPDLNETEILTRISQIRMDAWLELNDNLTALENIKVLNHIFFDLHHLDGNKVHVSSPQNMYINTLLETRKGNPLTLGMLYMIVARQLNLPVYGVNLPQHFILAYLTEAELAVPSEEDILFYINPFNKGTVFTRREIELFIRQMRVKPDRSHFAPCSNVEIIRRLLRNLIQIYSQMGYPDKIEILEHLSGSTE